MPYLLGWASPILLIAIILAAAMLVGHLYLGGLLSQAQLDRALLDLDERKASIVSSLLRSRQTLGIVAFVAGIVLGWLSAWQWAAVRRRQRPLVIADLRKGDMPFGEGVNHVRRHARSSVDDDGTAIALILDAAGEGRITLWQREASDTLSRVPPRYIRRTAPLIIDHASRRENPWAGFMLLRAEIEDRWPSGAAGQILSGRAIAAGFRH